MMGSFSLCWIRSVSDSLCDQFEGLLCGKLSIAMLICGLHRLGTNMLMLIGRTGTCVTNSAWVVMAW